MPTVASRMLTAASLCMLFLLPDFTPRLCAAELVKVIQNGKETSLVQKLITVKQTAVIADPQNPGDAEYVGPFNIFYHAKSDDGKTERLGYYRIATEAGQPLGWVKSTDVQVWGTRFAVAPLAPFDGNEFQINIDPAGGGGQAVYDPANIPESAAAYSFILGPSTGTGEGAEDDGPFPVCFCIADQATQGTAAEANQIANLQLEVVFVLELTDFFLQEYDGKTLMSYVQDLGRQYVQTIKSNQSAGGAVPTRLGLVVYQDTNTKARLKRPVVEQSLTDNLDAWLSKLNGLQADEIGADFPEDGLSGVAKTLSSEIGWKSNTSKHIVLIGHGAFQPHPRKSDWSPIRHQLGFLGDRGHELYQDNWDQKFGSNSSGMSIADLHAEAFPQGGTIGNKMRQTRHIHAVRAGEDFRTMLLRKYGSKKGQEILEAIKEINELVDGLTLGQIVALMNRSSDLAEIIFLTYDAASIIQFDNLALQQYEELAKRGDTPGYFAAFDPNATEVKRVVNDLKSRIDEAIKVVAEVAKGNIDEVAAAGSRGMGNEFSRPIFRLVNSAKANTKIPKPVQVGTAGIRSEKSGRLVGHKVIMVSQVELNRLRGTFNSLYEQFDKKRSRAQRQDVSTILDDLKKSLAQASSGQTVGADTSLAELITDLPLRTSALMLTAGDIAVMPSQDFEAWLDELQVAQQRSQMLLNQDAGKWIEISSLKGASDKYSFIKVSELP